MAGDQQAFDTDEWRIRRDLKLKEWLLGNQAAIDLFLDLSLVAEVWDDIVDGDKPKDSGAVNKVFWTLLAKIPENPFWVQFHQFLKPIVLLCANAYLDSQILEAGSPSERAHAYTLRLMALQLVPMMALIIGGNEHMRKVSLDSWRFFTAHDPIETWQLET